jgi:hypothetical protein
LASTWKRIDRGEHYLIGQEYGILPPISIVAFRKEEPVAKVNCWEFRKCGREPGGAMSLDLGVCPSATETRLDGTHDGINAGRACWVVARTLCEGKDQGTYRQKYRDCEGCAFRRLVETEEGSDIKGPAVLQSWLIGP